PQIHALQGAKCVFLSRAYDRQLGAQEISSGYWKIAVDIEFLRHVAEPCSRRPPNRSLVRYCADERTEQDRFAGAVRTNDRKRSPTSDGEIQVCQDRGLVKLYREALHLQNG